MGGESTIYLNLAALDVLPAQLLLHEGGVIVVLLCPASVAHGHGSSAVSCGK